MNGLAKTEPAVNRDALTKARLGNPQLPVDETRSFMKLSMLHANQTLNLSDGWEDQTF